MIWNELLTKSIRSVCVSALISVNNRAHLPKTQTQIEDHPNYFKYNIYRMNVSKKKENLSLDYEFNGILIGTQCREHCGFQNFLSESVIEQNSWWAKRAEVISSCWVKTWGWLKRMEEKYVAYTKFIGKMVMKWLKFTYLVLSHAKRLNKKKYPLCLTCDVITKEKIYSRPNRWRRNNFFNLN